MKNNRTLFPPLFGVIPTGGGGGGSGNKIQLTELPEASLQYKDKIVQYIGATTETLTNGYFYKCVEHTTTEGETITVTYSWDSIPVMEAKGGINVSTTETEVGTFCGKTLYAIAFENYQLPSQTRGFNLADFTGKQLIYVVGCAKQGSYNQWYSLNDMQANGLYIFQEDNNLKGNSGGDSYNNGKLYAIIYYIKTN